VLQVLNLAPHNLGRAARPPWFFEKAKYGGILTDIGSHQFEQVLSYAGARDAVVEFARVENFANPDTPELEDFGEAALRLDTGASAYLRVDWFNPAGHRAWGDGRSFVLGSEGSIEIRKNNDLAREPMEADVVYLVDGRGEQRIPCAGRIGFPFFGQLILDVLNRTESAMTQEHCFKAAELALKAQALADERRRRRHGN
jgi:predicted dehydrogenase